MTGGGARYGPHMCSAQWCMMPGASVHSTQINDGQQDERSSVGARAPIFGLRYGPST